METTLIFAYLLGVPVWFLAVVIWCALMLRFDRLLGFGLSDCKPIVIKIGLGGCLLWPIFAPVSIAMLFLIYWNFYCVKARHNDGIGGKGVNNGGE